MSRLICHAQSTLSENLNCYLDALCQALLSRGLQRKLYVDAPRAFPNPKFGEAKTNRRCARQSHTRMCIPVKSAPIPKQSGTQSAQIGTPRSRSEATLGFCT
jgi:hypothetical protein